MWKLHPIALGALFVFMPFILGILDGFIGVIALFADMDISAPFTLLGIVLFLVFFLIWTWSISIDINQKKLERFHIPVKNFKISFWFFCGYLFLEIFTKTPLVQVFDIYVDSKWGVLIYIIIVLLRSLAFLSYFHICLFTGTIVLSIEKNKKKNMGEGLFYGLLLSSFPIGIPIMQYILKDK